MGQALHCAEVVAFATPDTPYPGGNGSFWWKLCEDCPSRHLPDAFYAGTWVDEPLDARLDVVQPVLHARALCRLLGDHAAVRDVVELISNYLLLGDT